jgi:hypothetical protein
MNNSSYSYGKSALTPALLFKYSVCKEKKQGNDADEKHDGADGENTFRKSG